MLYIYVYIWLMAFSGASPDTGNVRKPYDTLNMDLSNNKLTVTNINVWTCII